MKKGAIFDMDGLLFDTERVYKWAWIETAKHFGKDNGFDLAEKVSGSSDKYCKKMIVEFYPDVDVEKFFRHVVNTALAKFEDGVELMEGVEEILSLLKNNGVKIAVASSSTTDLVERNLTRANLRKYFDAVIGGDGIKNGKPAPDIFIKAAEKLNLAPADCWVFEDSYNGIRGAAAAGCSPIMIPDTAPATDEMRNLCTGIYASLSDAAISIQ